MTLRLEGSTNLSPSQSIRGQNITKEVVANLLLDTRLAKARVLVDLLVPRSTLIVRSETNYFGLEMDANYQITIFNPVADERDIRLLHAVRPGQSHWIMQTQLDLEEVVRGECLWARLRKRFLSRAIKAVVGKQRKEKRKNSCRE